MAEVYAGLELYGLLYESSGEYAPREVSTPDKDLGKANENC